MSSPTILSGSILRLNIASELTESNTTIYGLDGQLISVGEVVKRGKLPSGFDSAVLMISGPLFSLEHEIKLAST